MVLDKFKDALAKAKNKASEMLDNSGILDNHKEILKGTSLESLSKAIESITNTTFTVTEVFVNEIIRYYAPDISIQFNDGHFILNGPFFVKITLAYDGCNFTGDARSVTLKILDLSWHAKPFLGMAINKFPFIEKSADADKTTLITCHLNKIPKLQDNKVVNSPYLEYVTIDAMTCEPGKLTVKFKVNKESLWDKARDIVVEKLSKRTAPHPTD